MATLNVDRVLCHPAFSSGFELIKRAEVVDANTGLSTITTTRTIPCTGTVQPASPKHLQRRDDGSVPERAIEVWTQEHVNHVPPADVLRFRGELYLVTQASSYHQFGPGFSHVVAELRTAAALRL